MGGYLSKKEIKRAGVAIKASKGGDIERGGAVKFIKDTVKNSGRLGLELIEVAADNTKRILATLSTL